MNIRIALTLMTLLCGAAAMAQKQFPTTLADKRRIVTGMEQFQLADDTIFANAVLWAVNEGPRGKEEIVDCDFQRRRLQMVYNLRRDDEVAYTCRLQVQVSQGALVFTVKDVKIGGLTGMLTNFDKLNPDKKTKHADIIRDFEKLNDEQLNELFAFIAGHQLNITNWKMVQAGQLERGMTEDEVLLIFGKPFSQQKSGTTVQYTYGTFNHVFIEEGIVKSFVN